MNKNNQVDIHLKFGDETDQDLLLGGQVKFQFGAKAVEKIKSKLLAKSDGKNDMIFEFKFHVPEGREKQAVEYLQRGMDEPDREEKKYLNPIQRFLLRPKSTGNVSFDEDKQMVIVSYCIYEQYTFLRSQDSEKLMKFLQDINSKGLDSILEFSILMRGEEGQSIKQKTQVQANYTQLHMKLNNFPLKQIIDSYKQLLPEQEYHQLFGKQPFISMLLMGLKKIKLNYSMIPLRRINQFYRQAAKLPSEHNPDKYNVKDLIQKKIEISGIVPNVGSFVGEFQFKNESVLERILKIIITVFKLENDL